MNLACFVCGRKAWNTCGICGEALCGRQYCLEAHIATHGAYIKAIEGSAG